MSCEKAYFNGWGSCASLLEKMNGSALQTKGETWTDTSIVSASTWHVSVASVITASRSILALPILSFENTTDDVEITTSQLGQKSITGKPIPSGMIGLDASLCDYKQLHALEDTWYEFFPFFQDGTFWATRKADGTLKGFRVKIGTKAGLPPEDKSLSYPMYLFFQNYAEFENVVVVNPDFNFSDVLDYSPVGMDIRITTDYVIASGVVIVKVTNRGTGEGHTGLAIADFEILLSNADPTVAISALTDSGLGVYSLTIQSDGAAFASGEYAIIQPSEEDATPTYLTYLGHSLKVQA